MKRMNKNTFILFYFSHAGLTCSSEIPYVVFFSVVFGGIFFSACGRVVPVFSSGHFFGTVAQNIPGLLGQSISLFIWAFINFVYDDQKQFSIFEKTFHSHVSGGQPEAVTSPCSSSQVSYVSLSTRETFSKVGRELLGAIASVHTQIISVLLDRIRETIDKVGMVSADVHHLNNLIRYPVKPRGHTRLCGKMWLGMNGCVKNLSVEFFGHSFRQQGTVLITVVC